MSHSVPRRKFRDGEFGPATIHETVNVPLAGDNLVCADCGRLLGEVEWVVVSSPIKKGIVAFACKEHIPAALRMIKAALGLEREIPDKLELPNENNN